MEAVAEQIAPLQISPSYIAIDRQCQRKASWAYVHRIRKPPSPARQYGTDLHAIQERYLGHGVLIDQTTEIGRLAATGLPYLPDVGSGWVEKTFRLIRGSFVWHGVIDWSAYDRPYVIDHKTTSDWKWVKPVDNLLTDPQVILYGLEAHMQHPSAEHVDFRWLYYKTKGAPAARPVDFQIDANDLFVKARALKEETEEIIARRTIETLSLPPTLSHCGAYGGCEYRELCTDLQGSQLARSLMTQQMPDLKVKEFLEQMKAKAAGASNGASTPAQEAKQEKPETVKQESIRKTLDPFGFSFVPVVGPDPVVLPPPEQEAKQRTCSKCGETGHNARTCTAGEVPAPTQIDPAKVQAAVDEMRQPVATPKPIGTLFIDCLPMDGTANDLSACFQMVRSSLPEPHYKLLEYGKGVGFWCLGVREWLQKNGDGRDVFADSSIPEVRDCLGELIALSANVVRGLR